ncbi:MAG TPA: V-type ATP synthase subunit F [Acholeplasmataceae bacterium]|nr:V-type ATP synthase subunit F [Acholeplasmataceae bacterium]
MEKNEIAAIGSNDLVILFNAVGIRTFQTDDVALVDRTIFDLANENYKIIYISEDIYEKIPDVIEKYNNRTFPILIPIPTTEEGKGIGLKKIKENVEKAIGFDIF